MRPDPGFYQKLCSLLFTSKLPCCGSFTVRNHTTWIFEDAVCLLRNMSVLVLKNLRDQDCKKGQVTLLPLISHVQFKCKPWISKPKKINLKLAEGNTFTFNLMNNSSNAKTYLKLILVYLRVREERKLDEKLTTIMETLKKILEEVKKLQKVPKKESTSEKAERELELTTAKLRSA